MDRTSSYCGLFILFVCALLAFARPIYTGGVISTTDTLSHEYPWRGITQPAIPLERYAHCDVSTSWHPWKILYHREFQRGHYPLWAQEVANGYPLFAHSTAMGYSLNIALQWFLPCNGAINLGFFLEIIIALAGMYFLLRSWQLSTAACLLGSLAFGLSYPMLEWLVAVSVSGAIMMLPCLFLALDKYRRTKQIRFLAWAALACAFGILNGSIQSMIYLFLAVFAFAVADCMEEIPLGKRFLIWTPALALFTALSIALAAVALIPALEFFLFHNSRSRAIVDNWAAFLFLRPLVLTPLVLIGTVYPGLLGNPQSIDLKSVVNAICGEMGFHGYWGVNQWSAYIGIVPLFLALLALGQRRADSRVRMALWMILLPAGLMVLSPLYAITYTRGLGVAAFGLAILSAIGLDLLSNSTLSIPRWLKGGLVGLSAVLIIGMCAVSFQHSKLSNLAFKKMRAQEEQGQLATYLAADHEFQASKVRAFIDNFSLKSSALWVVVLFCVALGLLLKAREENRLSIIAFQTGLVLLTLVDLAFLSWRIVPVVPADTVYPLTPGIAFLQKQPGLFRIDSAWNAGRDIETARPNQMLPYGLSTQGISESVVPPPPHRANGELLPPEYANARYLMVSPQTTLSIDAQRLEEVYHGADARIFRYRYTLPRAFILPLKTDETTQEARARLEQMDPQSILALDLKDVAVNYDNSEHMRLTFSFDQHGLLVLLDRMYPGWQATIQGASRPIEPVFGVMRSFEIKPGESSAQLDFAPHFLRLGLWLGIAALAISLGLLIRRPASS